MWRALTFRTVIMQAMALFSNEYVRLHKTRAETLVRSQRNLSFAMICVVIQPISRSLFLIASLYVVCSYSIGYQGTGDSYRFFCQWRFQD
jgi:hypothetical protein